MNKRLLLLCLSLNFLSVIAQTGWKDYSEKKFTLKYPDSWVTKTVNGAMYFTSPKLNLNDSFQENVNLMLQDLSSSPMTLEQYTELTRKQIVDHLGSSAIVSLKNTAINGHTAKEFIYNLNYQGKSLKLKQYWFIKDNVAYLFTYTAVPSEFNKYESLATTTITSFKLK